MNCSLGGFGGVEKVQQPAEIAISRTASGPPFASGLRSSATGPYAVSVLQRWPPTGPVGPNGGQNTVPAFFRLTLPSAQDAQRGSKLKPGLAPPIITVRRGNGCSVFISGNYGRPTRVWSPIEPTWSDWRDF